MGRGHGVTHAMINSDDIRQMLRTPTAANGQTPSWMRAEGLPDISPSPGVAEAIATAADILKFAAQLKDNTVGTKWPNVKILASSCDHEGGSTRKRFAGHIGVRQDAAGEWEFVGITTHGPATAPHRQGGEETSGTDLARVLDAVNGKLANKRRGKGSSTIYEPVSGTGPEMLFTSDVIIGANTLRAGAAS